MRFGRRRSQQVRNLVQKKHPADSGCPVSKKNLAARNINVGTVNRSFNLRGLSWFDFYSGHSQFGETSVHVLAGSDQAKPIAAIGHGGHGCVHRGALGVNGPRFFPAL